MVTREPFPVHPVTNHPFHVAPTLFTVSIPQHRLVPIYITTSNFTDVTCLDQLVSFHIRTLVMTLSTCNDTQVLCLSLLCRSHDGTITLSIYRNWFFEERVLTFLNCILEMNWTEYRRSSQNNHINTRINHLLVRIKTYETVFSRNFLIISFFQVITHTFNAVCEHITQCHYLNTIGSVQQIGYGTITTATTTNQTYLQFLAIDSLVRKFRYIEFTRLLQRNQLITTLTCRKQCRSTYNTTYTQYSRSMQKASSIHFFFTHSTFIYKVITCS